MLKRWITNRLQKYIASAPAVVLLGVRQVGKTTLAKALCKGELAVYLDLESPEDLLKLSDPVTFFTQHNDKLIILDEIQRMPQLFTVLRGIIDKNRELGRHSGQFLLLGSASMEWLRQSSESLAGRISYLEMSGFNGLEIEENKQNLRRLWLRGGFPNSYLASDDDLSMDWLENLVRTYLERDVPQMGFRVPANRLRQLWTMLAHLQGETINYSKLATNLEIDGKTVRHYIDILVDLLLVRELQPWHSNVKKRLVKSPRYYVRDSGILHRLLGIDCHEGLLSNPVLGKSWEGFVIENIHSVLPHRAKTYFYRTASGAEIDLIIQLSSIQRWAVEIKYGSAPKINRHFGENCAMIDATHKYVIYGGDDEFSIGNGVVMISLVKFLQKLSSLYK